MLPSYITCAAGMNKLKVIEATFKHAAEYEWPWEHSQLITAPNWQKCVGTWFGDPVCGES